MEMTETDTETRVSAELQEAQLLFQSGRVLEAATGLAQLGAEARSAGDGETAAAIRSQLSQMREGLAPAEWPNFDRAADGLAEETVSLWAALGTFFGFVFVALTPGVEWLAWLGADAVSSIRGLLELTAIFAGGFLGFGLVLLLASGLEKSPAMRVALGLLLIAWVAPLGAHLATPFDDTSVGGSKRDEYLVIAEVGGVPGLLGLASIGWAVRDIVRARGRRTRTT